MDDLAKEIGLTVMVAFLMLLMLGRLFASCVLIGWFWRAAWWLVYRSPVEPFPFDWLAIAGLCFAPVVLDWLWERKQDHSEV